MIRAALSWIVWPALIALGLTSVYFVRAANVSPVVGLVTLQLVVVAIVALLERWMPEHPEWNVAKNDVRTDALYLLLSGAALSAVLRTAIFAGVPSLGLWPESWPIAAQVVLAIALADLGSYVTHVLEHKASWLWPIHTPHHSARRLYWLNATRMHPFDEASTVLLSLLPLAVLGAPAATLAYFDAFAIVHLLLQHSNVRLRHGALSHVFATAEFHRWHHSPVRAEGEANYASFLSLWDRIFGTFRMPRAQRPPVDVGLYDGATIEDGFLAQLRYPFKAWKRAPVREGAVPRP